jgi:hypothetical protein
MSWSELHRGGSDLPHLQRRLKLTHLAGGLAAVAAPARAVQPLVAPPTEPGDLPAADPLGRGECRSCPEGSGPSPSTRVAYQAGGGDSLPLCSHCLTLAYTAAARPRLHGPIPDRLLASVPREPLPRLTFHRREACAEITGRLRAAIDDPVATAEVLQDLASLDGLAPSGDDLRQTQIGHSLTALSQAHRLPRVLRLCALWRLTRWKEAHGLLPAHRRYHDVRIDSPRTSGQAGAATPMIPEGAAASVTALKPIGGEATALDGPQPEPSSPITGGLGTGDQTGGNRGRPRPDDDPDDASAVCPPGRKRPRRSSTLPCAPSAPHNEDIYLD